MTLFKFGIHYSNILAQRIRRWTCGGNESCSDHNLIGFDTETGKAGGNTVGHARKRYHIKAEDWGKFETNLASNLLTEFGCASTPGDHAKWDIQLGETVKQYTDMEELTLKFSSIITATCNATFKVSRSRDRDAKGRSVPWWSRELMILRKRTLALREGTKGLGTMTTCDKRGSSSTRKGRGNTRQNSKTERLNLGRISAHAQLTPTRRVRCTNWLQGKCKAKLH